ncbi:MAG: trypsin-like peptidase domain-containing protein, partial [Clostridiaceae bacterium]|nr:trypsin-like peptidase domain-containing protein [Clostridiaceae bacterium]
MKKAFTTHIVSFILGVAITLTTVYLISDTKAEPTPEPTPIVIEKEVVKEIPVEVVKEVIKEVEKKTDLEEVVANCKNSCVMIYAYKGDIINQGSGWVYNGYVITAKHVVDGYKKIEVYTDDTSNARTATIEYIDPKLDLAVLKASIMLPSLTLGDSNKLTEGEKLVTITSPKGAQNMVDECIYSGIVSTATEYYMALTDTLIQGGSSGGAVFNYNSELIGMAYVGYDGFAGV